MHISSAFGRAVMQKGMGRMRVKTVTLLYVSHWSLNAVIIQLQGKFELL
jgi:hypothetical protein